MSWCLIPKFVDQFKQDLISGEINPEKLNKMSSKERHEFFSGKFGEQNATNINSLFESKLLLKNQQAGIIRWAEKVMSGSEAKRDVVSMVQRMEKILDPKTEREFLGELASKRLGVSLNAGEAQRILEISNKIKDLKDYKNDSERINYGKAQIELTDYISSLSTKKANLLTNVANVPRSIMASLDLSAPLNQGWGMLSRKQFYTSFRDMFKYVKSERNLKELQADIITRDVYPVAKKAGLRLTDLGNKLEMREEQFMSTLLDRVPGIAASQRAYTGFLNKLRIDVFQDMIKKAEIAGEDVSIGSKAAEDIAGVVNNFTGGARVGRIEGAVPALNALFFSPRKITSTLEMLNPRNYLDPKISKTARLEATRNFIGSLAISATVIALGRMLGSDKPETDPTSTDFGKIRVGNTRLDISGGNATYLTLLSRLISGETKNSSGAKQSLGNKFGQTSGADLIAQFLRYKLSPNASLIVDIASRANAIGQERTVTQSLIDRFKPMFASSVVELLQSDTDGKFALALGALFGAGLSTYQNKEGFIQKAKSVKSTNDMVDLVKLYIKAFSSDPSSAIKTLFTEEQLKDVRGGAVIMERMGLQKSQAVKNKGGAGKTDKLDHIIPLELGGDNSDSNLRIVTNDEWKSYTPIENYLGDLLNTGKINKETAQKLIRDFKSKKITADNIYNQYGKPKTR